jgi:hypothetical protein
VSELDRTPDYIVLRHGLDIPREYWAEHLEGRWYDAGTVLVGKSKSIGQAVAEPAGRFEVRDDGAVAEVWEIRLTTPNEQSR